MIWWVRVPVNQAISAYCVPAGLTEPCPTLSDASCVRAAGEVVGAMYADVERAEPGTNVVAARAAFARRRLETRWRWTPTSAEIAAIINAIWPETAGRKVELPPYERGASKRRYPVSDKSDHLFRECRVPGLKLTHLIVDRSERDLKGIVTQNEDEVRPVGEGAEHLRRGLGEFVE